MGKRRKAREIALQFLYQLDLSGDEDPTPSAPEFWARHAVDPEARAFADALVHGTKANQPKIDQIIAQFTEHWDLDRKPAGHGERVQGRQGRAGPGAGHSGQRRTGLGRRHRACRPADCRL